MNTASVAVLLVSADSLTSDFILREEIKRLLERREKEQLPIFPILVRPCAWEFVPWLAKMQIRPKHGVPLSAGDAHQIEENLTAIVREIKTILEKAAARATNPAPSIRQDNVPSIERDTQRDTEPPLPPGPPPQGSSSPQREKRDWLSWLSLPRMRIALSFSISIAALFFVVAYLLPPQETGRLDLSSETPPQSTLAPVDEQPLAPPPNVEGRQATSKTTTSVPEAPLPETEVKQSGSKNMISIPAGEFWMGCNEKVDKQCDNDEKPGRMVYLDAYSIDKYEVTVADYRRCVEAGKCSSGGLTGWKTCNWNKPDRTNYPINCVDWGQAAAYCTWSGKRLPTEAEWEKAARGERDRGIYPWGDQWNTKNANAGSSGTELIGSYVKGKSPYGAYDMVGNVWEWIQDWYDENYYRQGSRRDPAGPNSGEVRVLRGGSWRDSLEVLRVSNRYWNNPGFRNDDVGFRCAR